MTEEKKPTVAGDLREMLSEDNGRLSTTRVLFFVWAMVVLFVWAFLSLRSLDIKTLPWEIVGIVASFGGVKVAQKFGEKP